MGVFSFRIIIFLAIVHTITEVINMEKNKEDLEIEKEVAEEVETFNNHWGTGHFLGPNTLRYKENRDVYEEKDSE